MGEAKRRQSMQAEGGALDECPPARFLFIAIPAYTGQISSITASSLIESVPRLWAAGIQVASSIVNGVCYLDLARNILVQDFLDTEATDLLFIDADVGFTTEALLRVVLAPRPVVAAIYPKRSDALEFPLRVGREGVHRADSHGLLEVEMVPTGFLRINRMVFERIDAPPSSDQTGRAIRAWFRSQARDTYIGEDVDFCRRWRGLGGKVRIVPIADMAHHGMKIWRGNWGELARAEGNA